MATYDFTGANGDPLPSGLTAYNGAFEIQSNKCAPTGVTPNGVLWLAGAESKADGSFITLFNANGSTVSSTSGPYCRRTNNDNLVMAVLNSSDGVLKLHKRESGTYTQLGSEYVVPSFSASSTYKIEIVASGDQLSVKLDDVTVISALTEPFNQSATNAGLRMSSTAHRIDDLTIPDEALSTLNITFTNSAIPNATYDVDFYNDTTKELIETRSIAFTDSTLSEELPVAVATNIFGKVDGDNMPTNGAPFYGVTE